MPRAASAEVKPKVAYLGYLAELEQAKVSSSGNYAMMNYVINNSGAAGKKQVKGRLMFHPGWFSKDFLADRDLATKGERYIFDTHVASQEGTSALQAFVGTKGNYQTFDDGAYNLDEYTVDSVGAYIHHFITNLGHVPFGYILKQKKEGTGVIGSDGNEVKVLTPFLEVDTFFLVQDPKDGAYSKKMLQGKLAYAKRIATEKSQELGYEVEPLFRVAFDLEVLG